MEPTSSPTSSPTKKKAQELPDEVKRGVLIYLRDRSDLPFKSYCKGKDTLFGATGSTFRKRV